MEKLQIKKAIFTSNEIVILKKKGNIIINIDDIVRFDYTKPNFINYLFAGIFPNGTFPGYIKIFLNKKINKSKSYKVKIKYKDILKLPEVYRDRILSNIC